MTCFYSRPLLAGEMTRYSSTRNVAACLVLLCVMSSARGAAISFIGLYNELGRQRKPMQLCRATAKSTVDSRRRIEPMSLRDVSVRMRGNIQYHR